MSAGEILNAYLHFIEQNPGYYLEKDLPNPIGDLEGAFFVFLCAQYATEKLSERSFEEIMAKFFRLHDALSEEEISKPEPTRTYTIEDLEVRFKNLADQFVEWANQLRMQ